MKYLLVAMLALAGCDSIRAALNEEAKRSHQTTGERIQKNLECHWLPKYDVCFCLIRMSLGGLDYSYAGSHMPDHMCDGEEEGAIP